MGRYVKRLGMKKHGCLNDSSMIWALWNSFVMVLNFFMRRNGPSVAQNG